MADGDFFAEITAGPLVASLGLSDAEFDSRMAEAGGMVSPQERVLLRVLLRDHYAGQGAVIDGGSFFGSSIVAQAVGLRDNPNLPGFDFSGFPDSRPIHGYEIGHLPAPKSEKIDPNRVFGGIPYVLGDDFVPILEKAVAPYRDLVALHIGDLKETRWNGFPIELAFIDVCKTIALNAHVAAQFYPAMIGGASTLINQDFFFDRLPWIKVTMGYLQDYVRWEGQVGSSSVYSVLKPVPPQVAAHDPFTFEDCETCLRLHDAVAFLGLPRKRQYLLALSRGYLMGLKHRKDDALDYLQQVAREYEDLLDDADNPQGNRFRMDRAVRQISYGVIFKVS